MSERKPGRAEQAIRATTEILPLQNWAILNQSLNGVAASSYLSFSSLSCPCCFSGLSCASCACSSPEQKRVSPGINARRRVSNNQNVTKHTCTPGSCSWSPYLLALLFATALPPAFVVPARVAATRVTLTVTTRHLAAEVADLARIRQQAQYLNTQCVLRVHLCCDFQSLDLHPTPTCEPPRSAAPGTTSQAVPAVCPVSTFVHFLVKCPKQPHSLHAPRVSFPMPCVLASASRPL